MVPAYADEYTFGKGRRCGGCASVFFGRIGDSAALGAIQCCHHCSREDVGVRRNQFFGGRLETFRSIGGEIRGVRQVDSLCRTCGCSIFAGEDELWAVLQEAVSGEPWKIPFGACFGKGDACIFGLEFLRFQCVCLEYSGRYGAGEYFLRGGSECCPWRGHADREYSQAVCVEFPYGH